MKKIILISMILFTAVIKINAQFHALGQLYNTSAKYYTGNPNNYYKLFSGDITQLKSEKNINVQFSYEGMVLEKKMTEEQYIKKNVDSHDKREPGSGAKWLESWNFNKTQKNQPAFVDELNAQTAKNEIVFVPDKMDANYTMIVFTKYLYPRGYEKTELQVEISIIDTKNPDKEIIHLKGTRIKAYPQGYHMGSSEAMLNVYSIAGGYLGKYFIKTLFPNKKH